MDWKWIEGLENQYKIFKDGSVWSEKRKIFMRPIPIKSGYLRIRLRDGKRLNRLFLVHRLVAEAFLPNPENKLEVGHKNNVRFDNRLENLSWVTRSENNQKAWDDGNKKFKKTDAFLNSVRKNILKAIKKNPFHQRKRG